MGKSGFRFLPSDQLKLWQCWFFSCIKLTASYETNYTCLFFRLYPFSAPGSHGFRTGHHVSTPPGANSDWIGIFPVLYGLVCRAVQGLEKKKGRYVHYLARGERRMHGRASGMTTRRGFSISQQQRPRPTPLRWALSSTARWPKRADGED